MVGVCVFEHSEVDCIYCILWAAEAARARFNADAVGEFVDGRTMGIGHVGHGMQSDHGSAYSILGLCRDRQWASVLRLWMGFEAE
jgi:hypothetical protein